MKNFLLATSALVVIASAHPGARGGPVGDAASSNQNANRAAGDFLQGGATLTGLLISLGVEYAFAPNWSVKLEYDHVGYLSRTVDLATLNTSESVTTNTVKAGINYKFFGSSGVVVARE
jgi:opacity protein-like surface antigen